MALKKTALNFGGTGWKKANQSGSGRLALPTQAIFGNGTLQAAAAPAASTGQDFGQILANDPFYQASLANLNAQGVYDKSSRDAALRSEYIRFGGVPEGFNLNSLPHDLAAEAGQIIDPATRTAAQQNTTAGLSILARLIDAAKQADKRTVDVLGARGMFRSGDTGYLLGRNQLSANQARYDATNKFLDFIMGIQAAYVAAERQRQALLLQEQKDAAGRAGTGGGTGGAGGTGGGGAGTGGGHSPHGPLGGGGGTQTANIPVNIPPYDASWNTPYQPYNPWRR